MKLTDMQRGLAAIEDGVWVGDLPQAFLKGVSLKVRRLWNSEHLRVYGELTANFERDAEGEPILTPEQATEIGDECLKRTVLLDWRGIDDEFSPAALDLIFSDELMSRTWRAAIMSAARKAADTYSASLKADSGN